MVHTIYEATSESSKTGFKIEESNIFVSDGQINEAGIVEHMAQSVAAGAGYMTSLRNEKPKVGFIANIKDLEIHFLPKLNSEIITEVKLKAYVMNVTLVTITSTCNGEPVAECEMKVFIQE
jgi:predicted hotdog family 3-hydroxylacyl-ACP dehydratase